MLCTPQTTSLTDASKSPGYHRGLSNCYDPSDSKHFAAQHGFAMSLLVPADGELLTVCAFCVGHPEPSVTER